MKTEWLKPEHLGILNQILDQFPDLRQALANKIAAVSSDWNKAAIDLAGLAINPRPDPAKGSESAQSKTAEIKPRILDWFKAHPGKHALTEVRTDLGVAATSKQFKTAVTELVSEKAIKSSGKRGKGSEYWI